MSSIEIFKRRILLPSAMPAGFHSPPETLRDPLMVSQINKAIIYTHPEEMMSDSKYRGTLFEKLEQL